MNKSKDKKEIIKRAILAISKAYTKLIIVILIITMPIYIVISTIFTINKLEIVLLPLVIMSVLLLCFYDYSIAEFYKIK